MSKMKKKIEALLKRIGKLNDKLKKLRASGSKKKNKKKKSAKTPKKKTLKKKRVSKPRKPAKSAAPSAADTPIV